MVLLGDDLELDYDETWPLGLRYVTFDDVFILSWRDVTFGGTFTP